MSKEMPIVVSHYTVKTGYEKEVKNLIRSLEVHKLEYDVTAIESLGSWRANSNYVALQVKNMLLKYPDRNILRVDADAVFFKYPDLFLDDNFNPDIAAHIHTFAWRKNELLGGTLYFKNTSIVRQLVDEWYEKATIIEPLGRPGDLLQNILNSRKYPVTFGELPAGYCCIFDSMSETVNKVIVHYQASRRLKFQVNLRKTGVKV